MTQSSSRLLFVFLRVVFLEFNISLSIIALFVIIVIRNPKEVFLKTFRAYIIGSCITSSSKSIRAGIFLFTFIFLKPLFRLFLRLFGGFCVTKRIIHRLAQLGFFRLFHLRVFYDNTLSLYLGRSHVSETITLLGPVVYLPNIGSG